MAARILKLRTAARHDDVFERTLHHILTSVEMVPQVKGKLEDIQHRWALEGSVSAGDADFVYWLWTTSKAGQRGGPRYA